MRWIGAEMRTLLLCDEQEGLAAIRRCTECDDDLPTDDPLLAAGLPLLLATTHQAEAGRRAYGRDQHLGRSRGGSLRPLGR